MSVFEVPTYVTTVPLPAPVTSGSTVQSYTDPNGDVWVAMNGVSNGAWRRAKDVLHARLNKSAAFTITAGTTDAVVIMDGGVDSYGMYNLTTGIWYAPITGWWRLKFQVGATATAAASTTPQGLRAGLNHGAGAGVGAINGWGRSDTSTPSTAVTAQVEVMNNIGAVNDPYCAVACAPAGGVSLAGLPNYYWTYLMIDYMGVWP